FSLSTRPDISFVTKNRTFDLLLTLFVVPLPSQAAARTDFSTKDRGPRVLQADRRDRVLQKAPRESIGPVLLTADPAKASVKSEIRPSPHPEDLPKARHVLWPSRG